MNDFQYYTVMSLCAVAALWSTRNLVNIAIARLRRRAA